MLENEDSMDLYSEQRAGFKKSIEEKVVSITPLEDGLHRVAWDEKNGALYFQSNLRINSSFEGASFDDLPFKIGQIEGNFKCTGADKLVSLKGSPKSCRDFEVSSCNLKSLEGSPEACNNFNVSENLIKDIKGCPKYVFGDFNLSNNLIKNLDFGPIIVTGSCSLLGNSLIVNNGTAKIFSNMHRRITYNYMKTGGKYQVIQDLNRAIEDKSYVVGLMVENPEFKNFLGNFRDQIEEFDYISGMKDSGII